MAKRFTDEEILTALLNEGSMRAAARRLQCSRDTIKRRLDNPSFARELEKARQELTHGLAGILQSSSEKAVSVLLSVMETSEDERLRITAADKLLTHAAAFGKLSKAVNNDW